MAHYTPEALARELNHDVLFRQFILCKQLTQVPEGWRCESVGEYWIGIHPELPVSTIIFSRDSRYKGYMLGYVIDPFKGEYNKPYIDIETTEKNSYESVSYEPVEAYLDTLSGRFVCVVTDGQSSRVYLDASGSLSMVYDANQKIAAASSMLIPYEQKVDDDTHLIETLKLDEKNGLYPFGLTPRKNIKRLLPNHYLELNHWDSIRHWPTISLAEVNKAKTTAVDMGRIMEKTIDTIMQQGFKPYMSLTAGVDSRTMLACANKWVDDITFFTWDLPDNVAELDVNTAIELAKKHQLNHIVYDFKEASEQHKKEWLYATSLSIGEMRGCSLTSTINKMDNSQPYFAGNASALCGGIYWREEANSLLELSGKELVKRIGATDDPAIITAAESWLDGLSHMSVNEKLDLAYLEQRLGCWGGEISNGHAGGPFHIYPFSNRVIYESVIRSQDKLEDRKNKNILQAIINQKMPELMQVAFNGGKTRTLGD